MKLSSIKCLYLTLLISLSAGLGSCNLYRNYTRPEGLPVDSLYMSAPASADTLTPLGSKPWRELFTDRCLQNLIDTALVNNTDLQTAMLRIDEAEASLKAARMAFLPSLALSPNGSVTSTDGGKGVWKYEVPVSLSWEIDIFGKLRNAKKEAQAVMLQQTAYAGAVRSQLIATVAGNYYSLLMTDRQIEISDSTIAIWKEQVRTLELQLKVGDVRENAVSQARANLNELEAMRNSLTKQRRETENTICTLLGQTWHPVDRTTLDEQNIPTDLSAGLPMYLLSGRPDVVAAEMALAAAYYNTNQSRAAFYPALTLGGSAGFTNALGAAVTNPGGWILSALASITQPIFQRGKLISNLRISKDEEQIALLNYRQALLDAGQEVNDALYAIESYEKDIEYHSAQCQELERTVKSNELLFRTNNATYLELLSSRQGLLNARLSLVADRFNALQSAVTLYRALGGGSDITQKVTEKTI